MPLKGNKIKWYIIKLWNVLFLLPSHQPCWQGPQVQQVHLIGTTRHLANNCTPWASGLQSQVWGPPYTVLAFSGHYPSRKHWPDCEKGSRQWTLAEVPLKMRLTLLERFCSAWLSENHSGNAGGCMFMKWTHYSQGWGNLPEGNELQCLVWSRCAHKFGIYLLFMCLILKQSEKMCK